VRIWYDFRCNNWCVYGTIFFLTLTLILTLIVPYTHQLLHRKSYHIRTNRASPRLSFFCPLDGACVLSVIEDQSVQCNLPQRGVLHVDSFAENDRIILYYTSFKNYKQFMLLYSVLGPCVNQLSVCCHLKSQDQLFMTLIKLRLAKDDFELSILFDISEKLVSKVFICWLNFLFYQLSEIPCTISNNKSNN